MNHLTISLNVCIWKDVQGWVQRACANNRMEWAQIKSKSENDAAINFIENHISKSRKASSENSSFDGMKSMILANLICIAVGEQGEWQDSDCLAEHILCQSKYFGGHIEHFNEPDIKQIDASGQWEYRWLNQDTDYNLFSKRNRYWVILKKVSFGVFRTILVSKEEKNFTIKSKDKGLSLSKFSWYLVIVKIIKIRHSKGHISQTSHDLKNIFMQK